ncbi:hypothetical protein D7B24_003573 [Verticillium nonalfalfae]|uniref:Uncharacterized protein n=1 Tax=Verticillium nonalfalfae TaxID=1051616 RepID=A0A3M9YG27_9PEZI|nr:uncharacterized protein D7B24_003573 [Verticillium nonalfalfae]RNJ59021.1 hypothetical protein D7B24_003573 [Verticillium nonalfalfae]
MSDKYPCKYHNNPNGACFPGIEWVGGADAACDKCLAAGLPRGLNQCSIWQPMSTSLRERSRDNCAIYQEVHGILEPRRQHRW